MPFVAMETGEHMTKYSIVKVTLLDPVVWTVVTALGAGGCGSGVSRSVQNVFHAPRPHPVHVHPLLRLVRLLRLSLAEAGRGHGHLLQLGRGRGRPRGGGGGGAGSPVTADASIAATASEATETQTAAARPGLLSPDEKPQTRAPIAQRRRPVVPPTVSGFLRPRDCDAL